jgi:hypothetical protein
MVRLEGLGKLKKSTSSRTRTGEFPACSVVPQPTTLPRAPKDVGVEEKGKYKTGRGRKAIENIREQTTIKKVYK